MKLTKYERETIICYNEEETTASVYTFNWPGNAPIKSGRTERSCAEP